jgi:hypothetical protein
MPQGIGSGVVFCVEEPHRPTKAENSLVKNMEDKPHKSIWKQKWTWWQDVLVVGTGLIIGNFMSSGTISSPGEIIAAAVFWFGLIGFVVWQQKDK